MVSFALENPMCALAIGTPGSGKSVAQCQLAASLSAVGLPGLLVAPTNLAAINVGGVTIHSCAGGRDELWLSPRVIAGLVSNLSQGRLDLLRSTTWMIIDEVSQCTPELLSFLSAACQAARGNELPFGGIVVLACGDPAQLPGVAKHAGRDPLFFFEQCVTPTAVRAFALGELDKRNRSTNRREMEQLKEEANQNRGSCWAVATPSPFADVPSVRLCHNYRQAGDPVLRGILEEMRGGRELSDAAVDALAMRCILVGAWGEAMPPGTMLAAALKNTTVRELNCKMRSAATRSNFILRKHLETAEKPDQVQGAPPPLKPPSEGRAPYDPRPLEFVGAAYTKGQGHRGRSSLAGAGGWV
jgi:hypothetical protein